MDNTDERVWAYLLRHRTPAGVYGTQLDCDIYDIALNCDVTTEQAQQYMDKMKPPHQQALDPIRAHNVGESDYSRHAIQPWDIWLEYGLNPWDADIVKRILRTKEGQRRLDYEKIKHICDERIRQLDAELDKDLPHVDMA